jgi:hypothetical protein
MLDPVLWGAIVQHQPSAGSGHSKLVGQVAMKLQGTLSAIEYATIVEASIGTVCPVMHGIMASGCRPMSCTWSVQ